MCDDEPAIRFALRSHLEDEGFEVVEAEDGRSCIEAVHTVSPSLLLLDLRMPRMDGLTTLERLREAGDTVPVIVLTADEGFESALQATRLGAAAYLQKPFDLREVGVAVHKALAAEQVAAELRYLRYRDRSGYGDFVGSSPSLDLVYKTLTMLETVSAPTVLIEGESGTGKEVLARAIHQRGPRRDKTFVAVDCASLPGPLMESELFGHERGAFTDAKTTKRGLFEVAHGGVIFLDEIAEMPMTAQVKLLRALETRTIRRVGGVSSIPVDVALIAATNRSLREEVQADRFRGDLYFRLNVVPLRIPPLRDRIEDVGPLVEAFLQRFRREFGRSARGLTPHALQGLQRYRWPGNVRELRNVLERVVLLENCGEMIDIVNLPADILGLEDPAVDLPDEPILLPARGLNLEDVERSLIKQALERAGDNRTTAASLLGISRYALRYRAKKYGLIDDD